MTLAQSTSWSRWRWQGTVNALLARALDIALLDHVVIGHSRFVSHRELGIGFAKA